jgi:hypothetical protein
MCFSVRTEIPFQEKPHMSDSQRNPRRKVRAKQQARLVSLPSGLPLDDSNTPELFAACLGHSFDIVGRKGNLVELAVGHMRGEAPYMHSIWIEETFTDLSFPQFRLSPKMLRFVIDAIAFRIAAFTQEIEHASIAVPFDVLPEAAESRENQVADASNDRALLIAARDYLQQVSVS